MKELSTTIKTSVWYEDPVAGNPFYPGKSYCHGYDFYGELIGKIDFTGLIFLHLRSELPTRTENEHLSLLLSSIMNPGPRHHQNQAAMAAAVGGCPAGSAVIAGFSSSRGALEGGLAVEAVMRMVNLLHQENGGHIDGITYHALRERFESAGVLPGFGTLYGVQDVQALQVIYRLRQKNLIGARLSFFHKLEARVHPHRREWIRLYGVFAASLADLGFTPEQGHGLYLLASGVGMLSFLAERYAEKLHEFPTWFSHGTYRFEPKKRRFRRQAAGD